MDLRPYQFDLKNGVYSSWQRGNNVVGMVLPTGGGKTVVLSDIAREYTGASCAIAHRQELVSQISMAYARMGVRHKIIAPPKIAKGIGQRHLNELGASFWDPTSPVAVAGVDTLIRAKGLGAWLPQVGLWIQDEGHHVLKDNKWGKAAALFPNARGLCVTATPCRADGAGLGRHADGLIDELVFGPSMRDLIAMGNLTDYRIFAPTNDLDLSTVETGSTGDYKQPQLVTAVKSAQITGDVVQHYLRIAKGKRGVTFASDVETATEIAAAFNTAGVPAEVVSGKTDDRVRALAVKRLESGELLQLVNVDLFGEGFDLPAIEVVSFARPTQSYALYCQQFGRVLRTCLAIGKTVGIIIDHVGNVMRHGLPDADRQWTLDRREKRSKPNEDAIPMRVCTNPECIAPYERTYKLCPFCGHEPLPAERSAPEHVDGDLIELDAETLARMRSAADKLMGDALVPTHLTGAAAGGARKRHAERKEAQLSMRKTTELWLAGVMAGGMDISEAYKRFYWKFGVDVLTAQSHGRPDAYELAERISINIGKT